MRTDPSPTSECACSLDGGPASACRAASAAVEDLRPSAKGAANHGGDPHRTRWSRRTIACRAVPEVPENVHGRVNKLADRVRVLLAADDYEPLLSLPAQALDQLQQVLADVGLHVVNVGGPQGVDDLMHDLGLPPLCAVPMDTEPAPEASAPEAVEPELAPEHQVVRGLGQEAASIPPAQRASRSQHSASLVKCRTGEIRSCVERLDHGTDGVCERVGTCGPRIHA